MQQLFFITAMVAGFAFPPALVAPTVETTRVLGETTSVVETQMLPTIPNRVMLPVRVNTDPPPEISAAHAIVVDAESGAVLYEKNADDAVPIASLTKVLTWLTFYDHRPQDWNTPVALSEYNNRLTGAKLQESAGEHMTLIDLMKTALVGSANNATESLASSTGLPMEEFVDRMNTKAAAVGATTLRVIEPTGLSEQNVSSARDYAKLLAYARTFPDLTGPLRQNIHEFVTLDHGRYHRVKGTNFFAGRSDIPLIMAKTGYTDEAGWCVATVLTHEGSVLLFVVLGSVDTNARFTETEQLYEYVADQFAWS